MNQSWIVFVAVIAIIVVANWLTARRRRECAQARTLAVRRFAERNGLDHTNVGLPAPFEQGLSGLLISLGGNNFVNPVAGTWRGVRVWAADLVIIRTSHDSSGTQRRHEYHSIAGTDLSFQAPATRLEPELALSRFLENVGIHDFHTGNVPFDRMFHIATIDAGFAAVLLDPAMQRLLMQTNGRYALEFNGSTLVVTGALLDADRIGELLDILTAVRSQIPPAVLQQDASGDATG